MDTAQSTVARVALAAANGFGFVLAGGNAIGLHGIGTRPTEDIDLFTNRADPDNFRDGVDAVAQALRADGWAIDAISVSESFAHLTAARGLNR